MVVGPPPVKLGAIYQTTKVPSGRNANQSYHHGEMSRCQEVKPVYNTYLNVASQKQQFSIFFQIFKSSVV